MATKPTPKTEILEPVTISAGNPYHFLLKLVEHARMGYTIDGQRNFFVGPNACIADLIQDKDAK